MFHDISLIISPLSLIIFAAYTLLADYFHFSFRFPLFISIFR